MYVKDGKAYASESHYLAEQDKREACSRLERLAKKLAEQAIAEGAKSVVVSVSGVSHQVWGDESLFWCAHEGPEFDRFGLIGVTRDYLGTLALRRVPFPGVGVDANSAYPQQVGNVAYRGGRFEPALGGGFAFGGGGSMGTTVASGGSGGASGGGDSFPGGGSLRDRGFPTAEACSQCGPGPRDLATGLCARHGKPVVEGRDASKGGDR